MQNVLGANFYVCIIFRGETGRGPFSPILKRVKILILKRILCKNLKDEIFTYSLFGFSVIYLILYEEVSLGIYVWLFEKKDILFI